MNSLFETPCVMFTIPNAQTFRVAVEIIGCIRDDDILIQFFPDKFVIEECSDNQQKFAKLVIKKKNLEMYRYSPFQVNGSTPTSFNVTVNARELTQSINCDKKQNVTLQILCSTTSSDCGIFFCRDLHTNLVDKINATCDFNPVESYIEDPFGVIYESMEPNTMLNENAFEAAFNVFKGKKRHQVDFSLTEQGTIKTEATAPNGQRTAGELPPNQNVDAEYFEQMGYSEENKYVIPLTFVDITCLMKVKKLGAYNLIKGYMSIDYPLYFRMNLLTYGTFSIWFY